MSTQERVDEFRKYQEFLISQPQAAGASAAIPFTQDRKTYEEVLEKGDKFYSQFAKQYLASQDISKMLLKSPLNKRRQSAFDEAVAATKSRLQQPGRPLEVLLATDDKTTVSEAITLAKYASETPCTPETMSPFFRDLYVGNWEAFFEYWTNRFDHLENELNPQEGDFEIDDIPYGRLKQAAAKALGKEIADMHEGPTRSPVFCVLLLGIMHRTGVSHPGFAKSFEDSNIGAWKITEWLIQNGTPVDSVNVTGNTALCIATGCMTPGLYAWIDFAHLLLKGGANINHQNRQGHTALCMAASSSVVQGEDDGRAISVKWLLENGANPDIPDNSGFTPRMNGKYSITITQLFRNEDKRRAALPPHCAFCIYVPPTNFKPGLEPIAGGLVMLKEKESPRALMMCAICQKAVYCRKECQRADWKYHKRGCKATKNKGKGRT